MARRDCRIVVGCSCILFCVVSSCFALFEDQAGLFDWKQDYVGRVKGFHWEQSASSSSITGKKVLVSSEKNVIASINTYDGSIVWRRIFEPGTRGRVDAFLHQASTLISIHGGGQFVRSWQVASGSLLWEKSFSNDVDNLATGFLTTKNGKADNVIVATSTSLLSLRVSDGNMEWSADLPNSERVERWYVQERRDGFLCVGVTPNQRVTVVYIGPDGTVKQHKNVPAPWIAVDTSCIMMDGQHFLCYSFNLLHLLTVDSSGVFVPTDLKGLGVSTSSISQLESVVPELGATVLFRSSHNQLVLLSLTSQQTLTVHRKLDDVFTVSVAVHSDVPILLTLSRFGADSLKLKGVDLNDNSEIQDMSLTVPYAHYHGNPTKMYPVLFSKKKDNKPGCKLIFSGQDFSLHFVQRNKSPWRREEALAYILAVQMVDLPVSENQAKFEDEFGTKDEDILAMFLKRLKAQVSQLKGFVLGLSQRLRGRHLHQSVSSSNSIEEEEPEEEDLVRDDFNLQKIIIAATAAGKIYGIRSHNGKIAWQQFVPNLAPFSQVGKEKLLVFVQRTTAHFPHQPQLTVLGRSQVTGHGLLISLNPVSGELIKEHPGQGLDLGYKVVQADLLSEMDQDFLKGILLVDDSFQPHVYPKQSQKVLEPTSAMQHFFHLCNPETGLMTGYSVSWSQAKALSVDQVWSVDLQKSQQTITGVYGKRVFEHVHSQGRVLGDRSVLYKYLNPNMMVVVAEGEETSASASINNKGPFSFFSMYLVDGVTGQMVYHQTHKRSKGPVKVIHAENWVVYYYFNEKNRRSEMGVLELYEGKEQSNSTAFSSFTPPPPPLVLRQSYIFHQPIYAMEATLTEKGITSKSIILSLKMGGIFSLPKALLDPRRPVIPSQETMEEGTIPYIPEIALTTEALVNYNQSMFNVDGIFTGPAGLESTSLIFVYGVDLFYTRVMPSRMFDVLKEDFDYLFISGVLGLMILVSMVTQKLAAKKALNRAWK